MDSFSGGRAGTDGRLPWRADLENRHEQTVAYGDGQADDAGGQMPDSLFYPAQEGMSSSQAEGTHGVAPPVAAQTAHFLMKPRQLQRVSPRLARAGQFTLA